MLHLLPPELTPRLPELFTYPFCYTPHPLCVHAAGEVQAYLLQQEAWQEELARGKMFGVLVVQTPKGEVGYLAAFSGILAGRNVYPYFVPSVYDLLQPAGFFKVEEQQISEINRRVCELEASAAYTTLQSQLWDLEAAAQATLAEMKQALKQAKEARDRRRAAGLTPDETATLVRESQYQKAEYKRQERVWQERISCIRTQLSGYENEILHLKQERKRRSAALQQRLFGQFRLLNARGEVRDLCDIFADTVQKTPPAGAGECAAPKLLQYAYLHDYRPVAMAEFWWGASPKTEIRHHGHYYPACKGKCEPILKHMLQGLPVEKNPLPERMQIPEEALEIVYEDAFLWVVNKPAGMLSVPGKVDAPSVCSYLCAHCAVGEEPFIVHRLDMATSGLLVVAKNKTVHQHLQSQFENRSVCKRYIAVLEGVPSAGKGIVELPLSPNLLDRPRQEVDCEHGKPAVTEYKVLATEGGRTRVAFYPRTGRTHQLRVHAAHADGLHCPIVGDELYGKRDQRLYLHAEALEFMHPVTGKRICFERKAPF